MASYEEQIRELEEELRTTKYNKATQHHIGLVKAKLARLREKEASRGKGSKKGEGYSVRKSGDSTVILVGYPSVGKSTLLNSLTNAKSKVGRYAFTTLDVVPGTMNYRHAKIQVLDVPGLVKGASTGRGRGREVISVVRNADLAVIIVDVSHPEHKEILEKELFNAGIRLNQQRPDIIIKKTIRGGISISSTVKLKHLTKETIEAILREFKINNADVVIRENITDDQLIDAIEGNRVYIPSIVVINKADTVTRERAEALRKQTGAELCISAEKGQNIGPLKELIYKRLGLMGIYMKEPSKPPDMEEPLIMRKGSTLRDVCAKLHRDFPQRFKFARIWGISAKFPGQKILRLEYEVHDGDIVELHLM